MKIKIDMVEILDKHKLYLAEQLCEGFDDTEKTKQVCTVHQLIPASGLLIKYGERKFIIHFSHLMAVVHDKLKPAKQGE